MQRRDDRPSSLKEQEAAVVEVKLWEAFILHNRHNLYHTLTAYSIDHGPLENESELATVSFRFMARDWNNTLRDLLNRYNIPVIKESRTAIEKEAVWAHV